MLKIVTLHQCTISSEAVPQHLKVLGSIEQAVALTQGWPFGMGAFSTLGVDLLGEMSGPACLTETQAPAGYSAFAHRGTTWASFSHLWEVGVGLTISVALPALIS